ncbi:DHCW motif cupin fold protein [bacterium]|nr:DHCW motif cupin fold protein [bacterium]
MILQNIPFDAVDWTAVPEDRHDGETGYADWKTRQFGDIRVRVVTYSPGYKADHWCKKGHIIYCLEGDMMTELHDGRQIELRKGMSYQVEDGNYPHRSYTKNGAKLFIVD